MIEAKASRTRERKETVFNEKKTVRDFGSSLGMSAMAEESVQARFTDYDQVNQAITVIAGTDTQKELGYLDGVTTILWVDGLTYKDLNGNGQLDVYEDWRQDVDARVKDLYDQMTREERDFSTM